MIMSKPEKGRITKLSFDPQIYSMDELIDLRAWIKDTLFISSRIEDPKNGDFYLYFDHNPLYQEQADAIIAYIMEMRKDKNDVVNHPSHYTSGKIEVWDFIVDQNLNFLTGSTIKYICRAGKKDPAKHLEDLNKAKAFLEREIKRITDNAADH